MKITLKKTVLCSISVVLLMLVSWAVLAEEWENLELGTYNFSEFEEETGIKIEQFNQSSMLDKKVENGELPPVEERLPVEPLVMIPWENIGEYGGTLRWSHHSEEGDENLRYYNSAWMAYRPPDDVYYFKSGILGPTKPGVLEEWNLSEDAKVFTAKLREGLKWSDGVSVTTEDVEFKIKEVLLNEDITSVPPQWLTYGEPEGEVSTKFEIIDKYTFKLTFSEPYGIFKNKIRYDRRDWDNWMLPKHHFEQYHKDYSSWDKILPKMEERGFEEKEDWPMFAQEVLGAEYAGLGILGAPYNKEVPTLNPYILVEEDKGNATFERNPYYFMIDPEGNQLPYIDKQQRRYVQDKEMINMDIINGRTDVQTEFITINDFPLFKKYEEEGNYNAKTLRARHHHYLQYILFFNHQDDEIRDIIQDVRFRKALSVALDREQIIESVFMGYGRPAQIAPIRGSAYYEEWMEKAAAEYDPEKAKEYLDEMGIVDKNDDGWRETPNGNKLMIPFRYYMVTPVANQGAEIAKRYWEDIGIQVDVKQLQGSLFWEKHGANELVIAPWWLGGAGLDVNYWHFGFGVNAPNWRNWWLTNGESGTEPLPWAKEMMDLKEQFIKAPSEEERIEVGKKMWEIQAEQIITIGTVVDFRRPFIYSKDLGNISVAEDKDFVTTTVQIASPQWYFKEKR